MAVKLNATKREDLTKSATKQIRLSGRVPAVVYGKAKDPKNVSVDSVELVKTVRDEGRNAIISLQVENNSVDVMLHDYQIDPIKDELLHADFYIVNMSEEMDVNVAVRLDGESKGEKEGGVLQQPFYEILVRAKPNEIPEEIVIDVSDLDVGDSIMVSDIKVVGNYEILEDPDTSVVSITPPTTEEDLETDDVDENAEPELVGAEKDSTDEE
ncbi:50S ribosomal protein L25/general stress protein Ctc [Oceanobacillus kimchii]|uniref:Large ribosomal subunit protein bL25 n=1 Tax=Oceanobacillus kimchii TaxID=746691 RepID=A0ABQ5TFB0_9BACI|nr:MULTISPECIES: 50S ribosomal protein L25/general stress protein Ctc [Oceanobacillus]MCT1577253.1 50S ribosomal protein L25/general stress protein Ctc [Oceanobacillus kimchii]MCT2135323.1 50S ribosomal protein L25/general stress protein Ctc [Oceanobacillus kimchii]OEH56587.1 50S ribosomal protein L25/general stress protein Ctc [Oceanobacillus sp. E9]GLO64274.1 general stress protein CTC [Oceanobacillus kimchii]